MHKNYTGLLYISSVARFCTNASGFDGHSRSMSHKNQSAVLLKAIISGTVRFFAYGYSVHAYLPLTEQLTPHLAKLTPRPAQLTPQNFAATESQIVSIPQF